MTHARPPIVRSAATLVLALVALLGLVIACTKAPSSTTTPQPDTQSGEPIASGTIADAATPRAASAPPSLDPAHIEQLGAWVSANIEEPRYLVPVEIGEYAGSRGVQGNVVFGPHDARVTFVVFTDYECPYCKRLDAELRKLQETYPADVRVVMKQFPLSNHPRATIAARAVLAAEVQGRGQAMHSLVFASAPTLDDATLQELGKQAQVPDLARFWADVEEGFADAQIERDTNLGKQLAVRSTPSYFVNGVPHRGAKTFEQLDEIYLAELAVVDPLLATGAGRHEVYAALMHGAAPTREAEKPAGAGAAKPSGPRPGKPDPSRHYAVPVDDRPSTGPDDALVTIIEFGDYECPYCRKVQPTLDAVKQRYGNDVRIVIRQQPLPMHTNAVSAALAALAADRQGKYWDMHALLFKTAETKQLGNYDDLAKQLGLDLGKFRADMADSTLADKIAQDQKVAVQFGATGTPVFFINGRYLSGAQPIEAFEALIDEELAAAKAFAKKHKVAPGKLYATMSRDWETIVEVPPVAEHKRETIAVDQLPRTGKAKKPAITIVGCVDFDCPYCAKGAELMRKVLSTAPYDAKVVYHFAHFPLPMHKDAEAAHRAAIAAGEQGKFWEMHDLLFADRTLRDEAELLALASGLGLDLDKFRADVSSTATANKITDDKTMCSNLGVTGTPTYFVNGRATRGAVPFDILATVLDEELAGGFEAKGKSRKSTSPGVGQGGRGSPRDGEDK
jgi:protein-disulfide isomerase